MFIEGIILDSFLLILGLIFIYYYENYKHEWNKLLFGILFISLSFLAFTRTINFLLNIRKWKSISENFDIVCPQCITGNVADENFCNHCGKNLEEAIGFFMGNKSDVEITYNTLIEYERNFLERKAVN